MPYIISANYLNRNDKARPWLIREPGQEPEEARKVASLTATNVRFVDSSSLEKENGCVIVAIADTVDTSENISAAPAGEGLRFTGHSFRALASGNDVEAVDRLVLSADGSATNTSEGVTPDDEHIRINSAVFARGQRVMFKSLDDAEDSGPGDMRGDGHLIVLSSDGPDSDDQYYIAYDDGSSGGDHTHVDADCLVPYDAEKWAAMTSEKDKESVQFERGQKVVFKNSRMQRRHGPGDYMEGSSLIILSGTPDGDRVRCHYEDGRNGGDTHWVKMSALKRA